MVTGHSHQNRRVQISSVEEVVPGIHLIGFRRDFDFEPGQVLGISLESDGPRRLYSICSGNRDDLVLVLFNVIDEGYLTPLLSALEEGDPLWITEPRGTFTGTEEPAVWIAAGTGIAPFYSMFRSGLSAGKTLIHGNRYLEQFLFYDEFEASLGEHYIRCCTGEESEGVYHGRVTDYLQEQPLLQTDTKYYLCGSTEMVVDTRDILIDKGVPFDHIVSEIYF